MSRLAATSDAIGLTLHLLFARAEAWYLLGGLAAVAILFLLIGRALLRRTRRVNVFSRAKATRNSKPSRIMYMSHEEAARDANLPPRPSVSGEAPRPVPHRQGVPPISRVAALNRFAPENRLPRADQSKSGVATIPVAAEPVAAEPGQHDDLTTVAAAISSKLTAVEASRLEAEIPLALKAIGRCMGADRCGLFRLARDGATAEKTHEWCADEVKPQPAQLRLGDGRLWLLEKLAAREPVAISDVAALPDEAAGVQEAWRSRGTQSLLAIPLALGSRPVGFISLEALGGERHWTVAESRPLVILGEAMVSALERTRQAARLAALGRCLRECGHDGGANVQRLVELCGELLDASFAMYSSVQGDLIYTRAEWKVPAGYQLADRAEGRLSSDILAKGGDEPVVIRRLQESPYRESDPSVSAYGLQTVVGCAVRGQDAAAGALCVLYQADVEPTAEELHLVSIAAAAIGAQEEHNRGTHESRGLATKIKAIASVARQISMLLDLEALGEQITRLLQEITGCYNANLFLLKEGRLVLSAAQGGFENGKTPLGFSVAPGEGLVGQVAQTGRPAILQDVTPGSSHVALPGLPHSRSELALPIKGGEAVMGVLDLQAKQPGAFDETDAEALRVLADQFAVALDNARLFEETRRRTKELEALARVSAALRKASSRAEMPPIILDQVLELFRAEAVAFVARDASSGELKAELGRGAWSELTGRPLPAGESAWKRASDSRRPFISAAARADRLLASVEGFTRNDALACVPLVAHQSTVGLLMLARQAPFAESDLKLLVAIADMAGNAVARATLFDELQRANVDLVQAYDATIEGWSRALELRDHETEGHAMRVTDMAVRLARVMGIAEKELIHVRRGALLHDIGKMGVPDSILLKPGRLTDEEMDVMRKHTTYAYDMLRPIAFLRPALDIPWCHHEKWDGTGYPRGLKGEAIPLVARVFAVIDVWDALRFDRPYRKAWPEDKVLEHLRSQSGTHFDPAVAEAFLRLSAGTPAPIPSLQPA